MIRWFLAVDFIVVDLVGCPVVRIDNTAVFSYDALGRLADRQAPWPDVPDERGYETCTCTTVTAGSPSAGTI